MRAYLFVFVGFLALTLVPSASAEEAVQADFVWTYTLFGVQFYDESAAPGAIQSWMWVFGTDGFGSKRQNPLFEFPCEGSYEVTLWVKDSLGNEGNVTKTVFVGTSAATCGVLQRSDAGVSVRVDNGWVTIPQAFFLGLLVFSGGSLAMGVELRYIPTWLRWLLFILSLSMLLISFGAITVMRGG